MSTHHEPENAPAACRECALRLLDRRAHSRAELERKLRQRQFPAALIGAVADDLTRLRLLDDRQFALQFMAEKRQAQGWGPARLRLELRRRGLDGGLIEELLGAAAVDPAAEGERALAAAARFLRLRRASHRHQPEAPRQEQAALYRHLIARGHSGDSCRRAWDALRG